ncbi:uncharacterized protein MYCFIDRAFT_174291 [Pseudocercospora fijiensis CIRAD86]|uniref:Uncharacterized protein n=1 Tax=Pseudocercospora fijiensis (strain CIRAD86) TaxID=383855 RepID=M2ZUQ6_PSEFD|nr:uncharacterized protein MYCFIDRAFT_174291 [Pseudocercospora fijiensis CIRAD86]EME82739.1 hypothetical protein MYCFIDRAFT_174291 [Pseudocercospora fijiensis CIRAD86]
MITPAAPARQQSVHVDGPVTDDELQLIAFDSIFSGKKRPQLHLRIEQMALPRCQNMPIYKWMSTQCMSRLAATRAVWEIRMNLSPGVALLQGELSDTPSPQVLTLTAVNLSDFPFSTGERPSSPPNVYAASSEAGPFVAMRYF